jgi:UDP-N-acetylglucosamine:LPS N-acetylglucosamine transferase
MLHHIRKLSFAKVIGLVVALLFIACSSSTLHADEIPEVEKELIFVHEKDGTKRPANIMLFTCQYGNGHKMATQGIVESLPDSVIQVVDIYADPLKSLDPMRSIASKLSYENLYNDLIKKEHNQILNWAGKMGPKVLMNQRKKIEKLLTKYISKKNPDMLISCIPLVNPMLQAVAKKLHIPLLVITTDIDISAFCEGFSNKDDIASKQNFRITCAYAEDNWNGLFLDKLPRSVQNSLQYKFGYPTRRAFSQPIDADTQEHLRKEYEVQKDENLILVMMGGNTAQAAKNYAELLLNMTDQEIEQICGKDCLRNKIRLICLCGDVSQKDNLALMTYLNKLNQSKDNQTTRVKIHACPGTPKIAELVSLPELCTVISKPGGSTVGEMIKKRIPMVYHISQTPLNWEKGNMEYGESRDFGRHFEISKKDDTKSLENLVQVLTHTFALHKAIQTGEKLVPEAEIDFSQNLRAAVTEMLVTSSAQDAENKICQKSDDIIK